MYHGTLLGARETTGWRTGKRLWRFGWTLFLQKKMWDLGSQVNSWFCNLQLLLPVFLSPALACQAFQQKLLTRVWVKQWLRKTRRGRWNLFLQPQPPHRGIRHCHLYQRVHLMGSLQWCLHLPLIWVSLPGCLLVPKLYPQKMPMSQSRLKSLRKGLGLMMTMSFLQSLPHLLHFQIAQSIIECGGYSKGKRMGASRLMLNGVKHGLISVVVVAILWKLCLRKLGMIRTEWNKILPFLIAIF